MKKNKILSVLIAVFMLAALCFSLVACSTPSDKTEEVASTPEREQIIAGGMEIGEVHANGIQLLSAPVNVGDFEEYGISALAENAITVNAIITPSDAANQGVDWTIGWTDPSASWASGKNVSTYVTFAKGSTSKTVTITCLQPFGAQITLTAKSQDNPSLTSSCKLEYAQKVTAASLNIGNIAVNFGGTTQVKYEIAAGASGPGGVISANVTTNDVYTIAESFTKTVKFEPCGNDVLFKLNDRTITGMAFGDSTTDWLGKEYYFDYDHDICKWMIVQRTEDILFKNLTTAEIATYFDNITVPQLRKITLTLAGKHNTYTYTSELICSGYTSNKPVSKLSVDLPTFVF